MLTHLDFIGRIAAGAALGGVIGFERDLHGRHVGLRTHLIVAMTAATFMVISAHFAFYQGYGNDSLVEVDASRIAASVVSGIGFLAGGAILRTGFTLQGMTTAAGLWLVTAIGLSAGAGMYIESSFVTFMGVVALTFLRRFEDKDDSSERRKVTLILDRSPEFLTQIITGIEAVGGKVRDIDYENKVPDKRLTVSFEVQIPLEHGLTKLAQLLEAHEGVLSVRVHSAKS